MLKVRSKHQRNGQFYTLDILAKDVPVGSGLRADYNGGPINLPEMQSVGEVTHVYLYQPTSGPAQPIARVSSDQNRPDPARSRLVCAFGTYNYADHVANWSSAPMTFRQVGHDVFFDYDANVQSDWRLPGSQQWAAKSISNWVPDGVCDLVRLRVEVGAQVQGAGDYFVQANIASESDGSGSKEVKGRSPIVDNNKYVVALIEVPLLDRYIHCCGTNAIADILCFGYRLDT